MHTHATSDLGASGEADRYRGAGGVAGGVLRLGHAVALVDRLTATELAVLRRARTESRLALVVAALWSEESETVTLSKSHGARVMRLLASLTFSMAQWVGAWCLELQS